MSKAWWMRRLALASAMVMALALCGCPPKDPASNGTSQTKEPVTVSVAANLPMTGTLAVYGTAVQRGAEMATEELASSDPEGPVLKFDWQDNASDPKTAVSVMQQEYLNPPDIYTSGLKPQTMAIMDQVAAKGTPHFVWIFDPTINEKTTHNVRTYLNYKLEAPVYVDYAKRIAAKKVAIIYVQLPHTIAEFDNLVIPGLKDAGITDITVEAYDIGKQDFKDISAKLAQKKPDLLILNGFIPHMVGLVRALRPLNLITDGNTITTFDLLDQGGALGADELEGIRVVSPVFLAEPTEAQTAWRERFKQKYNEEPTYTAWFGHDMAVVIHDAAKRITQPATAAQWLDAIKATNTQGITGDLKLDRDGDLTTAVEVGVYRGGQLVPANQ